MPLPERSDISDFDANGKINGVIPPALQSKDWDNPSLATAMSDVAALGQTAPRFWCRMVLGASTGALSIPTWYANWINATNIAPIPGFSSTGVFTITLPTVVNDEYDASVGIIEGITVVMLAGHGNLEGTTPGFINVSASGNIVTVHTFNSSGSANNMVGVTASIFIY